MKVFGFHEIDEDLFDEDDTFAETYYNGQNFLNALGWIPFFGTVVGTVRLGSTIIIYLKDDAIHKIRRRKFYMLSIFRSIVELFSVGFVFIIPDLLLSLEREK